MLILALLGSLFVRYGEAPSERLFTSHLTYFLPVMLVWVLVFFMAGLYERTTQLWHRRLPQTLLRVQVINLFLAVAMFYLFIPDISPKTILAIFLFLSSGLLVLWRLNIFPLISARRRPVALLVGRGIEAAELYRELSANPRLGFTMVGFVNLDTESRPDSVKELVAQARQEHTLQAVIVDVADPALQPLRPFLYDLSAEGVKIMNLYTTYEDLFGRVPLVALEHTWFPEKIKQASVGYQSAKRILDVLVAVILGVCSLPLYVFAYLAIKLDDGGDFFIIQERVGYHHHLMRIYKIRTMRRNDAGNYGGEPNAVTRVGRWLRLTRVDELPQLWNVLRGDLSLVGPRPELPALVALYEKQIPYYNLRHQVPPGLSGWAQIYQERHPHHREAVAETVEKLSYDLYYLRHRSWWLDLVIMLKTVKALISRAGV